MVRIISICLLILIASTALAQQTVTSGPWSITAGPAGPDTITYQGQPILRGATVNGFLPNWTGTRFNLGGSKLTTTADSLTWTKQDPASQDVTLTVTAAGNKLTFVMQTTMRAEGPVEYSVNLVPEAVATTDKYAMMSVNGKPRTLDLLGRFDHISGVSDLRFEQIARSIIIRSDPLVMQDRRDRGQGFFLVFSLNGEGKPVTETRKFELEVQETRPEDLAARKAVLSQIAMDKRDIPVANGGFESGLDQWSDNPRAAIDTTVKYGGNQSARITIPADQTDRTGIYLVQNVPIIGGRLYSVEGFLKSQDVKAASLGEMSATGATIILEWADKEAKWLASGDYAKGLYGTTDWQRVSTRLMRAPKDAAFAIIFLSLRATGTGWFDDITMTEVTRHVVLTQPLFGEPVADNTPGFAWQLGEAGSATLELSTDPAFPADKTTRYENLQSPFSPDKPLAPGKWHWRVTVPDHGTTSIVWNFDQTAPLTADCSAPKISPDHANLTAARQPVTVRYSDNVAVTRVNVALDGKPVQSQMTATGVKVTPPADWIPGLHKLQVTAADAAGNQSSRMIFLNYAPGVTKKQWLANGGIAIGGKPQFLLGMYGVRTEDLPEMAKAGYDFVHNYTWDGPGTNQSAIEYLDACHKLGLQAFIGFDRSKLLGWDEEFVAERVGSLSRHPALLAWYLFDEPDLPHQYVPPNQLRALYNLIHTLDPMHPVIVTVAQTSMMPLYNGSYDVYWSMDYQTPAANVKNFEGHRAALQPGTPIMSIVHSYDNKQQGPTKGGDPEKFQPGPQQLRACAFMAIAHNSSGLAWWWWGQGSDIFMTVAHAPKAWAALKETISQIRSLRPALEAQVEPRMWVEKPAEGQEVHFWQKTLPGRTVIIAVNREKTPCDLTFSSPAFAGKKQATVLFENRSAPLKAGKLTDKFEGWDVHVYEVK
ncbi:MAG: hypothetical protein ACYC63_10185 [Armatimonadota bacterium]